MLGERLGAGSYGTVCKVTKDGLVGAVKFRRRTDDFHSHEFLLVNLLASESTFLKKTLNQDFPYLPKLLQEYTVENGWSFMVLEYFQKGSLFELVQNTKLPPECIYGIGLRLVKGLQVLHETLGRYHLDIKPGNVMIKDDPHEGIAIIDFGLSLPVKYTEAYPRKQIEGSYDFLGSYVWQLEPESPRDDLESAGLVMAWLFLDGHLPWSSNSPEEMKQQLVDPDIPHKLGEECKSTVIQEYLQKVIALKSREKPDYNELVQILCPAAGAQAEILSW